MRIRTLVAALGAVFLLAGCGASQGRLTPEQQLQLTCDGMSSTVRVLAGYRAAGSLSDADVVLVEKSRGAMKRLCSGSVTDYAGALSTLTEEAFLLLTVRERAGT